MNKYIVLEPGEKLLSSKPIEYIQLQGYHEVGLKNFENPFNICVVSSDTYTEISIHLPTSTINITNENLYFPYWAAEQNGLYKIIVYYKQDNRFILKEFRKGKKYPKQTVIKVAPNARS